VILIRTAVPGDAMAIAAMAIAFRDHLERTVPTDAQFRENVALLLGQDDAEFFIATRDGIPAGYVLQRYRHSMWASGTEAAIEDLFVDPAVRRSGIGRQLIGHALDRAATRDCVTVCLDTNENNVASTRIYTGFGFNAVSKRWNGRQIFFRLNLER